MITSTAAFEKTCWLWPMDQNDLKNNWIFVGSKCYWSLGLTHSTSSCRSSDVSDAQNWNLRFSDLSQASCRGMSDFHGGIGLHRDCPILFERLRLSFRSRLQLHHAVWQSKGCQCWKAKRAAELALRWNLVINDGDGWWWCFLLLLPCTPHRKFMDDHRSTDDFSTCSPLQL